MWLLFLILEWHKARICLNCKAEGLQGIYMLHKIHLHGRIKKVSYKNILIVLQIIYQSIPNLFQGAREKHD